MKKTVGVSIAALNALMLADIAQAGGRYHQPNHNYQQPSHVGNNYLRAYVANTTWNESDVYDERGFQFDKINLNKDSGYGVAVGKRFGRNLRAEIEVSQNAGEVDGTTPHGNSIRSAFDSTMVLGNVYYDFNAGSRFRPFVVAGVGFARNKTDGLSINDGRTFAIGGDSNTDFAWTAGVGASYDLSPRSSVDVTYRYVDAGEAQTASDPAFGRDKYEVNGDQVMVGYTHRW